MAVENLQTCEKYSIIRHLSLCKTGRVLLNEPDPIAMLRPGVTGSPAGQKYPCKASRTAPADITFDRHELNTILNVYGARVAAGDWRDYAISFGPQKAVFAIYQRTSDFPVYRLEKIPSLTRKQGAYCVVAPGGRIIRRGNSLDKVLTVLRKKPRLTVL